MAKVDPLWLGRSIQRHIKKLASVGYSHPPITDNAAAVFTLLDHTGRRFEVRVREISVEEELSRGRP